MLYVVWIKLSLNESYGNRFSESLLFISKFKNLVFTICSILGVRADAGGFGRERSIPTDAFRISNPGSVTRFTHMYARARILKTNSLFNRR